MDWLKEHARRLVWNRHQFEIAALRARTKIARNDLLSGVVWAQVAANAGWYGHPGFYASTQLESILVQAANELEDAVSIPSHIQLRRFKKTSHKLRVLHVITEAYATGGHTRAVESWIRNSGDSTVHSLVATNQKNALPLRLTNALKTSGGIYCSLSDLPNPLHRAIILRQVAKDWPDIVVLHVHPDDALPLLSFGIDGGPPIVFFNHADHAFWLGCSVADVVADIRPLGQRLSLTRRGVKNSAILPVPLSDPGPTLSRDASRRSLGIGIDKTVLLTIAGEARYSPFGEYDFLSTAMDILQRDPETILLAVGLGHTGRWTESPAGANRRIIPMGVRTDLDMFYACADIYLPSFPLGGLTSMLDAGLRGIPILGLIFAEAPHLCGADDLALDGLLTHVSTVDEYVASAKQMIENRSLRHEKGRVLQECVRRMHVPPGWNDVLEKLLRSLPDEHRVQVPSPNCAIEIGDVFQAGIDATMSPDHTLFDSFQAHVSGLPLTSRVDASLSLLLQALSQPEFTSGQPRFLQAGEIAYTLLPRRLRPVVSAALRPFMDRIRDR